MLKTIIYLIFLLALICVTALFVLYAVMHWKLCKEIKGRVAFSVTEKERDRHQRALNGVTIDGIGWTAIAVGSVYGCFDCFISLLNTL